MEALAVFMIVASTPKIMVSFGLLIEGDLSNRFLLQMAVFKHITKFLRKFGWRNRLGLRYPSWERRTGPKRLGIRIVFGHFRFQRCSLKELFLGLHGRIISFFDNVARTSKPKSN